MSTTAMKQDIQHELLVFVRMFGAPCFERWPSEMVETYLAFHAANQSLVYVRGRAGNIAGLAVAWRCAESRMEEHWVENDPTGDSIYVAHIIAADPQALLAVTAALAVQFPGWEQTKLFARRARLGLVRVERRLILKLIRKAQHEILAKHR